jgi:outer membrane protein assembly factor BamE (lipoprotein component of BamABCDE complex)
MGGSPIDTGSTLAPYAIASVAVYPRTLLHHEGKRRVPAWPKHLLRPNYQRAIALTLCLSMTACGWILPPAQTRGNKVEPEQLKELVPGTSTKADVTALIGSPTQRATFDENTWLYITELTRPRLGRTLGVLDQEVVVLTFDDRGVLTTVKTVGNDDAVPVSVASRTTPSPGTEASFMQQLLGNIGKFNAGGAAAPTGGGAGPSSGPGL